MNLRKLQVFVRKPGLELEALTFVDEGGNRNSTLSEEHVGELIAIRSYLNYLQNWYGPPGVVGTVDISHTTREEFLFFIDQHADQDLENDPVRPDNDLMVQAQQLRAGMDRNNTRSRSNSQGSSRSTSPTVRRVVNQLLTQFNKGKRPLTDYTMSLEDIMQWPEWDRQLLDALAHAHSVEKVLISFHN